MKIKYRKYWRKNSLKKKGDGDFLLNHIKHNKPKNFLEIGVFHGVTSRNICELLHFIHGNDFMFTGIDLFLDDGEILKNEYTPKTKFSNILKTIYYRYIVRMDPYNMESVLKFLKKFKKNINKIKGNYKIVLKEIG